MKKILLNPILIGQTTIVWHMCFNEQFFCTRLLNSLSRRNVPAFYSFFADAAKIKSKCSVPFSEEKDVLIQSAKKKSLVLPSLPILTYLLLKHIME